MLSTDEPIALLIEKFDALASADRAAILKRLSPQQRAQISRLRARRPVNRLAPHSPGLAHRIAELDSSTSPLTPAARDALRRAIQPEPSLRVAARGASLVDAAGGLFRKRSGV